MPNVPHGPVEFDGLLDALLKNGFELPFAGDKQANRDALASAFVTTAKLHGLRIRVEVA